MSRSRVIRPPISYAHVDTSGGYLSAWERSGARDAAKLSSVSDGLSRTVLVAEKAGWPKTFIKGVDTHPDTGNDMGGAWVAGELGGFGKIGINESNFGGIYSFHPSGAHVLMADGSVRLLDTDTPLQIIVELCSRAGHETDSQ